MIAFSIHLKIVSFIPQKDKNSSCRTSVQYINEVYLTLGIPSSVLVNTLNFCSYLLYCTFIIKNFSCLSGSLLFLYISHCLSHIQYHLFIALYTYHMNSNQCMCLCVCVCVCLCVCLCVCVRAKPGSKFQSTS